MTVLEMQMHSPTAGMYPDLEICIHTPTAGMYPDLEIWAPQAPTDR
jgi:hypothetical protein